MGPLSFSREEDASPFDSYCSGSMAGGRGLGLLPTIAHTDFLVITLFSDRSSNLGFLNLITTDILTWVSLCCGHRPMQYRMWRGIPDLYPLSASSNPSSSSDNPKGLQMLLSVP